MKKIIIFILLLLEILLNEFSLRSLSNDGEIDVNTINKIRFFNLIIFITIVIIYFYYDNFIKLKLLSKILVILIYIIFTDYISGYINIGYKKVDKDAFRYIFPYDWIRGEANQLDHNEFGFRGKPPNIKRDKDKFIIAFFGGSTGYNGNPTIAETLSKKLNNFNIDNEIINFSSVSSNHNQHLHRLLQFSEYTYDLIIFYGGGNETIQHYYFDPRPGYPYNFYLYDKNNNFLNFFIKYSNFIGEIDKLFNINIGFNPKRANDSDFNDWAKKIKKNYFLTIKKSKYLSKKLIKGNNCESAMFLPIFQPLVPPNKRTNKLVNQIKKDLKKFKIKDFSYLNNILTFSDFIHIDQKSKEIVANEIYILVKEMLKDEKNCLNF